MASVEVLRFAAVFASGATVSSEVDFGKAYGQVFVELPSGSVYNVNVQAAGAAGGDFKRLYHAPTDADAVVTAVEITSATAGNNGAIVPIPNSARYMKIEVQTAITNGGTFHFICRD